MHSLLLKLFTCSFHLNCQHANVIPNAKKNRLDSALTVIPSSAVSKNTTIFSTMPIAEDTVKYPLGTYFYY